jgi:AcrR family transcriptional regulator
LPTRGPSGKVAGITAPATPTRPNARERILASAVRLIAREGIDDVRLARIATDAGVSAALVSYHFATRDALLAEALEHSYEYAGTARIGVADDDASAAVRLAAMIDQCLPLPGELRDDWVLWVELWLRAVRHPELRPTAAHLYARMHVWFAEAIAEGVATGEFTAADPERTADRLLALIDGYGIRALNEDPTMPVGRAREEIWAAIAGELGVE